MGQAHGSSGLAEAKPQPTAQNRLLVIDDEHGIAELIRAVADGLGFESRTASSAKSFMQACDAFSPTVIVMAIVMPEVDGIELLHYLAARRFRARIVLMSGALDGFRPLAETLGIAQGLDVVAGLAKPFRLAELRELLAELKA
jgi:DNA-binding response OmpR family regulator